VARCPHVGRCLGWINGGWREPSDGQWVTGHLGMVQQLLAPAQVLHTGDGWKLLDLAAYVVDKAAYEAVHESRNGPDWLPIPMAALQELAR
jgi:predicted trehalose synthase